jgi:trk system potassium uptake protein
VIHYAVMRIIIIGAGTAGRTLAGRLCEDKHDVVLIDCNKADLEKLDSHLDILTIEGSGSNPHVLARAGIDRTDFLVAVTNIDEVNILSCLLAHAVGVKAKVARVACIDLIHPPEAFALERLGIDLIVSQAEESAIEIYNMIRIPGAQEVIDLLDAKALCAGFKIPTDSPLLVAPIKALPDHDNFAHIRFVAYQRAGKVHIPDGNTQFGIGDDVYLTGQADPVRTFFAYACPSETMYTRVVIAGGGELGFQLARLLEKTPFKITLIEQDAVRAEFCSDALSSTLVINGNALDEVTMEEVGINDQTTFVAVTGDEEKNIMSCLVAERMGAHFTSARIENPDYPSIIYSLSLLDRVIRPHSALINKIYHFVRGQSIKADAFLQQIPGELLEIDITEDCFYANKPLTKLALPNGSIIPMALRNEEPLIVTHDYVFLPGDTILVYALPKTVAKINNLFT